MRRAVEKGRLSSLPGGKLDPALVGTGWREANRRAADTPADRGADTPPPVRTHHEPQPHGGALARKRRDDNDDAGDEPADAGTGDDEFLRRVLSGDFYKLAHAERAKENALALKHLLAARQAAGELVELQVAEGVLFETARAARNSWINWPARVGPLVAADLGLEAGRVVEVLTAHVHEHLAQLGEPEPDFRPREHG